MENQENSSEKLKTPEEDASNSNACKFNSDVKDEPLDFLDDLLEHPEQIAEAIVSASEEILKQEPAVKAEGTENDEEIDPNFFDELIPEEEEERSNNKVSVVNVKRERTTTDDATSPKPKKNKHDACTKNNAEPRLQVRTDLGLFSAATGSKKASTVTRDPIGESLLFMDEIMRDEKPIQETKKKLTVQEKMSRALERIIYAKKAFEKERNQSEKKFYPKKPVFVYTQTVRKLPSSSTHFTQQLYDNRSPLHTVNNVIFSFNSTTTRLNLHEWGLEAPPPAASKVARILGYDAETLYLKRNSIKIPDKVQKSQSTAAETDALFEQSNSTLFINATAQTDEVRIVPIRGGNFFRHVGLQFKPLTSVASTQTSSVTDLPLMQMIKTLNENQLQAVDDFVQLITEPFNHTAIDIYEKRARLYEIYKISQQASLVSSPMPQAPPPPSISCFDEDNGLRHSEINHQYQRDPRFNPMRGRPSPYQGRNLEPAPGYGGRNTQSDSKPKMYGRGAKRW